MKKLILIFLFAALTVPALSQLSTVHLVTDRYYRPADNDSILINVFVKPPIVKDSSMVITFVRSSVNDGITIEIDRPRIMVQMEDTLTMGNQVMTWREWYNQAIPVNISVYELMMLGALQEYYEQLHPPE